MASPTSWHLSQDLKLTWERAMWPMGEEHSRGSANANGPRRKHVWGTAKRLLGKGWIRGKGVQWRRRLRWALQVIWGLQLSLSSECNVLEAVLVPPLWSLSVSHPPLRCDQLALLPQPGMGQVSIPSPPHLPLELIWWTQQQGQQPVGVWGC